MHLQDGHIETFLLYLNESPYLSLTYSDSDSYFFRSVHTFGWERALWLLFKASHTLAHC
jgi:hypothetical protein